MIESDGSRTTLLSPKKKKKTLKPLIELALTFFSQHVQEKIIFL